MTTSQFQCDLYRAVVDRTNKVRLLCSFDIDIIQMHRSIYNRLSFIESIPREWLINDKKYLT